MASQQTSTQAPEEQVANNSKSGAIVRYAPTAEKIWEVDRIKGENFQKGVWRILYGVMKKLVVADRIAPAALAIAEAPDSFRGIYVPHYIFSASVKGQTNLEATQTVGDDTCYYNTTVQLDHSFTHILHDASREMPDAMSEKIAQ